MRILAAVKKLALRTLHTGSKWVKHNLSKDNAEDIENDVHTERNPLEDFSSVLAALKFGAITNYVTMIRRSQVSSQLYDIMPWSFECTVEGPPLNGSFNILFPVLFGDGKKWLLKVPAHGHGNSWTESAASSLSSEALTMRYLKGKNKSVPIPEVYAFDISTDNVLKCPFILMEYVEGCPLYKVWFDPTKTAHELETFREPCLQSLASAMIHINTIESEESGLPLYGSDGHLDGFGSLQVPIASVAYDQFIAAVNGKTVKEEVDSHCIIGPFQNMEDYMHSMLDTHTVPENDICQGEHQLLRLFVQWASQRGSEDGFVFAHPDFDMQNVLVDWEGVVTVPRQLGLSFPMWLTRDWNPFDYDYGQGTGRIDNSPEELMHYRKRYAQFVEEAMMATKPHKMQDYSYHNLTRQSILIWSLRRAVTHSGCTADILYKICTILEQITSQETFKIALEPGPGKARHQSLPEAGESKTESDLTPDEVKEQKPSKFRNVNTEPCNTVDKVVDKNLLKKSDDDICSDSMNAKAHEQVSLDINNGPDCALDGVDVLVSFEVSNSNTELSSSSGEGNVQDVTSVKSPPSTLSSESPPPSIFSKSSSQSSGSSTGGSKSHRAITPPPSSFAGSKSNGSPKMAAIEEEEANESAVTIFDAPQVPSGVCRDHVVPDAPGHFTKSTVSRLASVLRKVSKSVQSAFDQQKNIPLTMCGPTGLAQVVTADTAKIITTSCCTSNTVPDVLNSQIIYDQALTQMDISKSLLTAESTLAEATHQLVDKDIVKTDSCEHSGLDSGLLGRSNIEAELPCTNVQDDYSQEQTTSLEVTTVVESSSTCNRSEKQPVADELQCHGRRKTNFSRRVLKKLAVPGRILVLHLPVGLRTEDTAIKETKVSRSRKKSVARWAKNALRKTFRSENSSSLTGAPTASDIIEASEEPKEGTTQAPVFEEDVGDISSKGGAFNTATNIFDLQNLEPVDEDQLWDEGFTSGQIMVDLAQGKLDEARMQRLKAGFYALLDSVT